MRFLSQAETLSRSQKASIEFPLNDSGYGKIDFLSLVSILALFFANKSAHITARTKVSSRCFDRGTLPEADSFQNASECETRIEELLYFRFLSLPCLQYNAYRVSDSCLTSLSTSTIFFRICIPGMYN